MNASDVNWIIEDFEFGKPNIVNGTMLEAIQQQKYRYISNWTDNCDFLNYKQQPFVIYGSIPFVRKIKQPFFPGVYGGGENLNCNVYYANIPNEWLLNEQYLMVPFYKIEQTMRLMGWNKIFVRPNSGNKTFTGFVIDQDNAKPELSATLQTTSVYPETICLLAPARRIDAEFRFVIGNGRVIDGSEYRWDNVLDIRQDWDSDCYDLACKMALHSWHPDIVYTCDVALTNEGPKIVELNGFSSAGMYAMDKKLVVDSVSEIAYKQFIGEL